MGSEKVKEIKKALQDAIDMGLVMGKNTMFVNIKLADILTLINELESDNKSLQDLCNKTYEDLTKEIDRLENLVKGTEEFDKNYRKLDF